jgi:hypothetical protein
MKYRLIHLAFIGAATCFASAAAHAQNAVPPLRAACGADMQAHCPGLKGPDARMCLRAYHATISPDCLAFLEQAKAQRAGGAMSAPAAAPSTVAPPPATGSPPPQ